MPCPWYSGGQKEGKRKGRNSTVCRFDRDRWKQDMTDYCVVMIRNNREGRIKSTAFPQGINQPCFFVLTKRLDIHLKNRGMIHREFGADDIGSHPPVYAGRVQKRGGMITFP